VKRKHCSEHAERKASVVRVQAAEENKADKRLAVKAAQQKI